LDPRTGKLIFIPKKGFVDDDKEVAPAEDVSLDVIGKIAKKKSTLDDFKKRFSGLEHSTIEVLADLYDLAARSEDAEAFYSNWLSYCKGKMLLLPGGDRAKVNPSQFSELWEKLEDEGLVESSLFEEENEESRELKARRAKLEIDRYAAQRKKDWGKKFDESNLVIAKAKGKLKATYSWDAYANDIAQGRYWPEIQADIIEEVNARKKGNKAKLPVIIEIEGLPEGFRNSSPVTSLLGIDWPLQADDNGRLVNDLSLVAKQFRNEMAPKVKSIANSMVDRYIDPNIEREHRSKIRSSWVGYMSETILDALYDEAEQRYKSGGNAGSFMAYLNAPGSGRVPVIEGRCRSIVEKQILGEKREQNPLMRAAQNALDEIKITQRNVRNEQNGLVRDRRALVKEKGEAKSKRKEEIDAEIASIDSRLKELVGEEIEASQAAMRYSVDEAFVAMGDQEGDRIQPGFYGPDEAIELKQLDGIFAPLFLQRDFSEELDPGVWDLNKWDEENVLAGRHVLNPLEKILLLDRTWQGHAQESSYSEEGKVQGAGDEGSIVNKHFALRTLADIAREWEDRGLWDLASEGPALGRKTGAMTNKNSQIAFMKKLWIRTIWKLHGPDAVQFIREINGVDFAKAELGTQKSELNRRKTELTNKSKRTSMEEQEIREIRSKKEKINEEIYQLKQLRERGFSLDQFEKGLATKLKTTQITPGVEGPGSLSFGGFEDPPVIDEFPKSIRQDVRRWLELHTRRARVAADIREVETPATFERTLQEDLRLRALSPVSLGDAFSMSEEPIPLKHPGYHSIEDDFDFKKKSKVKKVNGIHPTDPIASTKKVKEVFSAHVEPSGIVLPQLVPEHTDLPDQSGVSLSERHAVRPGVIALNREVGLVMEEEGLSAISPKRIFDLAQEHWDWVANEYRKLGLKNEPVVRNPLTRKNQAFRTAQELIRRYIAHGAMTHPQEAEMRERLTASRRVSGAKEMIGDIEAIEQELLEEKTSLQSRLAQHKVVKRKKGKPSAAALLHGPEAAIDWQARIRVIDENLSKLDREKKEYAMVYIPKPTEVQPIELPTVSAARVKANRQASKELAAARKANARVNQTIEDEMHRKNQRELLAGAADKKDFTAQALNELKDSKKFSEVHRSRIQDAISFGQQGRFHPLLHLQAKDGSWTHDVEARNFWLDPARKRASTNPQDLNETVDLGRDLGVYGAEGPISAAPAGVKGVDAVGAALPAVYSDAVRKERAAMNIFKEIQDSKYADSLPKLQKKHAQVTTSFDAADRELRSTWKDKSDTEVTAMLHSMTELALRRRILGHFIRYETAGAPKPKAKIKKPKKGKVLFIKSMALQMRG